MSARLPGGFSVSSLPGSGKVWIQSPWGEGGSFCAAEFEAVLVAGELSGDIGAAIKQFFAENF